MHTNTQTIFLSGLPGSGKSTVGGALAKRLGRPFVDLDQVVEGTLGESIATFWKRAGEEAFRAKEATALEGLLADPTPRVVALGGGTVTNRDLRRKVLAQGLLVTLEASLATLTERLGENADSRPIVGSADVVGRLGVLARERAGAYAEAHSRVFNEASPEETVDVIAEIALRDPMLVALGRASYPIDIVHNRPERLIDAVAACGPSSLVVVTDSTVARLHKGWLDRVLHALAVPRSVVTLAPGESHKNLGAVGTIWDAALGLPVDRDSVVLALGGGVVCDLAGFCGSTLLRGLRTIYAPTTFLAMCDAAVGGKTGFDHPTGKNLIGTFHQPSLVVMDLAHLATLPRRELRSGLAEAVKIGLTLDAKLFTELETHAEALASGSGPVEAILRAALRAKIRVVESDVRDASTRAILNAGHTIGHALEAGADYTHILHGEAVAMGLVAELSVGEALGHSPASLRGRTVELLGRLGLRAEPTRDEQRRALRFLSRDKKRSGDAVRLPLATSVGQATLVPVPLSALSEFLSR